MVEFMVVGGLQDEPGFLLLRADDGRIYLYDPHQKQITLFQPNADCAVTVIEDNSLVFEAPAEMVAS